MKDKVLKAYAKMAKDYERHVDTESAFNAYYERPAMMKLVPDDMNGLAVLDAGCAAGWYTEQFIKRKAQVTAIDLSPEMVEATKRRVGEKATVFAQDLCDPQPFPDDTFDLVVSSLTLHYVEDWSATFREFRRVLKPGGSFIYSVHHPFSDLALSARQDYFARELLEDVWNKKESGRVEVTFFRRSFHEIINTTTEFFPLEQIVEPQPVAEFKEAGSSEWYHRLMTQPHFLIVHARK